MSFIKSLNNDLKEFGSGLENLFSNDVCNPGVKLPGIGWLKHPGKYHDKCGCAGNEKKCPDGYFSGFYDIYDENNPVSKSIINKKYSGKNCGEISGKYPSDNEKWNKSKFEDCVNLQKFNANIDSNLRKLQPIHKIYKDDNIENFSVNQDKKFYVDYDKDIIERSKSFNNQLKEKNRNNYDFLYGQSKSTSLLRKSNTNWKNMMDQMHDFDKEITNQMQVKTRLAEINNDASRYKSHVILVISGAFSAFFIGLFAWVGYMSGNISMSTMVGLFILATAVFIIIAIGLNTYVWKKFKKYSDKLKKDIVHEGDKLNMAALEWVDDNCDCPEDDTKKINREIQDEKIRNAYNKRIDNEKNNDDSIYYDDGTIKYRIGPSEFAKETGYLPCDIQDKSISEIEKNIKNNRDKFNNVINKLSS